MKKQIALLALALNIIFISNGYSQGTFSETSLIGDFSGLTSDPPSVGMANSGEALIAYRRPSDGSVRAYYRAAYGAPFTTKFLGENASTPTVIVNDAGDMLAGWIGGNGVNISFKKRGTSTFTYKLLDINFGLAPKIGLAMNTKGDIQVAWRGLASSPSRYQIRTFYKAANAEWPAAVPVPGTSGSALPHEVILDTGASQPFIALDDSSNAAVYWIDSYATLDYPGPEEDGVFKAVKQMLRQGAQGSWSAPVFVTPTKSMGQAVPCDSTVSGFFHVEFMQLASDPKTGLLGLGLFYSDNWNPYQSTGEQSGECQNASDGSAPYNPGFATTFGSVLSGIGGAPGFAFRGPEMHDAYLSVSNASSAVALYTDDFNAVSELPATFRIGMGNPGSPIVSDGHVLERIVDVRVSLGADGTALATAFGSAGPAFGDPNQQEAAYAFVKRSGAVLISHELLPEAAMAGVGTNCRGDGLFAVVTNGDVAGEFERRIYFAEYDSGNPTCVDGVVDPTPVPTLTPTMTPTVDPSVPTAIPTPQPTADIFAQAKRDSAEMYDLLTKFYSTFKGFKHPLNDKPKDKKKLKAVKAAWNALMKEFPGAVPELFFISGKDQAGFNEGWIALKKNYKKVMRSDDDDRPYRLAKRLVESMPDILRRTLGYF